MHQPESVARPLVHGVLITYRRPVDLAETLRALLAQSRPPDTLVVVDNDPSCSARSLIDAYPSAVYVAAGDNLGPAGGLALGVAIAIKDAADDDWILLLDDDDPPTGSEQLAQLYEFADRVSTDDSTVGVVGLVGARYNVRRGRNERIGDSDLHGVVRVDSIGGNQLPMCRVRAVRTVGVPDASLFFGLDDLEYGLRFVTAGWRIVVDGDEWKRLRAGYGRGGLDRAQLRTETMLSPWRAYYASRNLILIARRFGGARGFISSSCISIARLTRALLQRQRRSTARMIAKGCIDGWLGRGGRRVDPA